MSVRRIGILVSLSLVAAAWPALADEGRTPIPFTAPVVTPIVISAPGSYVLTRNLTASAAGGAVISIATPPGAPVELDLNGMVLTGAPGFPVIDVPGGGTSEVTIRNGSLVGGSHGILVFGASRKVIVEEIEATDQSANGIRLNSVENFVIRDNVVSDSGSIGIVAEGGTRQGKITGNLIRRAVDGICVFSVEGVEVSRNHVKETLGGGPFLVGIFLDSVVAAIVKENTVEDTDGIDGIRLSFTRGSKLVNNVVREAGLNGIFLTNASDNNFLLDNVVTGSAADGILIESRGNKLERNTSNVNGTSGTGYGFHFGAAATGNVVGDNMAVGHPGGPCVFPWSPDYCDDFAPPGAVNVSQFDNYVPPAAGPF